MIHITGRPAFAGAVLALVPAILLALALALSLAPALALVAHAAFDTYLPEPGIAMVYGPGFYNIYNFGLIM